MTEYGRIHTDGSRSGGQPIPSKDCPKCERFGDDCGEHSPSWQELAAYWKAEAERLRQPTQSDALRDQLLQECLVKLRDVQGTEAPKQYACNLIKRIERVIQGKNK